MSFLNRFLKQTCTYWSPGTVGADGRPAFGTPTTMSCRWEDRPELVVDKEGREVKAQTRIYLEEDVELGGYLFLGTSTASDPKEVEGASEIMAFSKLPSIKGDEFERKAWLTTRYRYK